MKTLIKGNLIMNCVANSDVNMYVQAGWKIFEKPTKKEIKDTVKKTASLKDKPLENENNTDCDVIKK